MKNAPRKTNRSGRRSLLVPLVLEVALLVAPALAATGCGDDPPQPLPIDGRVDAPPMD